MHAFRAAVLLMTLVSLSGTSNSRAANITIIESQSLNPFDVMDVQWQTVATVMGHTATIMPQTTLDTGAFIPGTDVLIVSSGTIPLSATRMFNIYECVYAGKGAYIQAEDSPNQPGNIAFQYVCNQFSSPFSWITPVSGLLPPTVHGPTGAEFNAKPQHFDLYNGCIGSGGLGVFGSMRWLGNEYGFLFDPPNAPFAGLAATNSDQEWVRIGIDYDLMENYINVLLQNRPLDRFIRIFPTGATVIPSSGGVINYSVQVAYLGTVPVSFWGWVRLILPSGAVFPSPIAGPVSISWPGPMSTPVIPLALFVPSFAPPGNYYIQGMLANPYPGFTVCFDSDNFSFQKMTVAADGLSGEEPVGGWNPAGDLSLLSDAGGAAHPGGPLPAEFRLGEPYPNPFNPSTTLTVSLGDASRLTVAVYDLQGREVMKLANGNFTAGEHSFRFEAHGLASGVYFVRATVPGNRDEIRKLVLIR